MNTKHMDLIRKSSEEIPKVNKKGDVTFLTFPSISKCSNIVHGFSTRLGGVSSGIYESMNLSFTRGDEEDKVRENFRLFTKAVGLPYDSIVMSDQTHTTRVRRVYSSDRGNGLTRGKSFFETDGLVTNDPDVALFTSFADCVPLFFVDPVNNAIGLTHSGWRGTVGRIGARTVELMVSEFGSNPSDIIAAVGPSICVSCYEVSEDVAKEFTQEFGRNADKIVYRQTDYFREHKLHNDGRPANEDKYQLDLWQANRIVLTEAGIREDNLSVTNVCTCCNPDILFSHRASQGKRGNLAAVMMIRSNP